MRRSFLLEFLLQLLQVKARAFLHWRELEESLRCLCYFLLNKDEAPELVCEPVVVGQGSSHARAFVGIETQIDQDGPINLDRRAQPAVRLKAPRQYR